MEQVQTLMEGKSAWMVDVNNTDFRASYYSFELHFNLLSGCFLSIIEAHLVQHNTCWSKALS